MKYDSYIEAAKKQNLDFVTLNDSRILKFIQAFSTYYPISLERLNDTLNGYKPMFDFFEDSKNINNIRNKCFETAKIKLQKIKEANIKVDGYLYKKDNSKIEGYEDISFNDNFDFFSRDFLKDYVDIYNSTLVEQSPLEIILKTIEKRDGPLTDIRSLEVRLANLQKENKILFKKQKCKKIAKEIKYLKEKVASNYNYIHSFSFKELELINDFCDYVRIYDDLEADLSFYKDYKESEIFDIYDIIMSKILKEMIDKKETTLDNIKYVFEKYDYDTFLNLKRYSSIIDKNIFKSIEWIVNRHHHFRRILKSIEGTNSIEEEKSYFVDVDLKLYKQLK